MIPAIWSMLAALSATQAPPPHGPMWILFSDKGIHDESALREVLSCCESALPPRARLRRGLRRMPAGLVDSRDIPICPAYIDAVEATGACIRVRSPWINGVSVEADARQLHAIAALPFVCMMQPVLQARTNEAIPVLLDENADAPIPRDPPSFYGASYAQLNQINVVAAHAAGYTGEGIIIGILDTGFNRVHDALNQTAPPAHPVRVLGEHDFINNDGNTANEPGDPSTQHNHGTYILGTLAAYQPGVLVGAAFDASYYLAKTEDVSREVPIEEDFYVAGLQWHEAHGADVVTSSLGYINWYTQANLNGRTAVTTIAVNTATQNGVVCLTAAGNGGHDEDPYTSHLLAPADAFDVLACGAADVNGLIAGFSSDGPTADGRVKPEVLACGVATSTISATDPAAIRTASGTSLSTPLVAGAAALLVQAHPTWTVDQVRRALLHTARDYSQWGVPDPARVRGWGVIDVLAAIAYVHGDLNRDGALDGDDIPTFVSILLGILDSTNTPASVLRDADINADGVVNDIDAMIFVSDLLRG